METITGRERRDYDLKIWTLEELNKLGGRMPNEAAESNQTTELIDIARERLESIRNEKGYSKIEFSRLLGIKRPNYDNYLNTEIKSDVSLSTLVKLFRRRGYKISLRIEKI